VLVALDKLDKVGRDGVAKELVERGVEEQSAHRILSWVCAEYRPDWLDWLEEQFTLLEAEGRAAFDNLRQILKLSEGTAAGSHLRVEPSLARGLSYYTGAIMEINVPDLAGSLGGGGRYDNLVGMFLGQSIPASGFSLGLERILVVMGERGMFPPSLQTAPADVLMSVFDAGDIAHAVRVAGLLRAAGLRVFVYPDADKIGKQIKYADARGIPCVAMLGSDEVAAGTVTVKHLPSKTQNTYDQAAAGAAILEVLTQRG